MEPYPKIKRTFYSFINRYTAYNEKPIPRFVNKLFLENDYDKILDIADVIIDEGFKNNKFSYDDPFVFKSLAYIGKKDISKAKKSLDDYKNYYMSNICDGNGGPLFPDLLRGYLYEVSGNKKKAKVYYKSHKCDSWSFVYSGGSRILGRRFVYRILRELKLIS